MAGHRSQVYRVGGKKEFTEFKNASNKKKYKIGEKRRMGENPNIWAQNIPQIVKFRKPNFGKLKYERLL